MISGVELLIEGLNLDVDWDSERTDGTQLIGIPTLILPQLSPSLHWRHYPVPGSLPYLLLLFSIPSFYTAGAPGPVSFLYRFNDTVAQTKSMVSIRTAVRRNEN
jgi:hypothetical protein